jgi:hypothetical protein
VCIVFTELYIAVLLFCKKHDNLEGFYTVVTHNEAKKSGRAMVGLGWGRSFGSNPF